MSYLGSESGGGEADDWLRQELGSLIRPDINWDNEEEVARAGRLITQEEFILAPETDLLELSDEELRLGLSEGEVAWRFVGIYEDAVVIYQEGLETGDTGYLLVGGSVFMTATVSDSLTEEQQSELPNMAWYLSEVFDPEDLQDQLGAPFKISPGMFCKEAHLYYRVAYSLEDLQRPELIRQSWEEPLHGSVISVETNPNSCLTLFVSDTGYLTPSIHSLKRSNGEDLFQPV